jgi:hypothetical protein
MPSTCRRYLGDAATATGDRHPAFDMTGAGGFDGGIVGDVLDP